MTGRRDGIANHGLPGNGTQIPGGRRQIVIKLDSDVFAEVRTLAERDGVSTAHQLRLLIEWGLEAVRDDA